MRVTAHERERAIVGATQNTLRTFDSKLKMMPGVCVPLRSMLVTAGREEILISPVGTAQEASGVGDRVTTLVAPSLLHHLHLVEAVARYRPLAVWGPPGLSEKRPELAPIHVFGRDVWPHGADLEFLVVDGAPARNEVVLFHRASRTLYTADLFFNILEPEGFLTPFTFRAMGIWKRFGMMRMWKKWVTDRAAFQRSIEQMMDWDFQRIVVAHGAPVERDAKDLVIHALAERELLDHR
ncbi:MAG: hypothetical protein WKG01_25185 [Kofleriaceae bacterium]